MKDYQMNENSDHDLLIRVHENVVQLTTIITSKFDDHEARLRLVEADDITFKGFIKGVATTAKIQYGCITILAGVVAALWWIK